MKKIIKADLPVEKRFITVEEGRAAVRRAGPISWSCWRNTPKRAGSFQRIHAGRFHRPVRRPAPDEHRRGEGREAVEAWPAAYWRGDAAARQPVTVCTASPSPRPAELEDYLNMLEEAQKARPPQAWARSWSCSPCMEEGPGFPFFLPKGMILKNDAHRLLARNPPSARAIRRSARPSSSAAPCGSAAATGTTTRRTCTPRVIDDDGLCHQAHELPGRHAGVQDTAPLLTGTCPCAWASWALCTGTSCPVRCTA